MLMQLRMLKLSVEKGRQVILKTALPKLQYCRARGVCALQSSSLLLFFLFPPPGSIAVARPSEKQVINLVWPSHVYDIALPVYMYEYVV